MSGLPLIAGVAAVATLVGSGITAYGQHQEGVAEQQSAYAEAHSYEALGRQQFAAAQRDALEAKRQGALVESRQRAVAAASGGGVDTPTIVDLLTETGALTDYSAQSAMYAGASTQSRYNIIAQEKRASGDYSLMGSNLAAIGTLAGGIGTVAGRM